jgi:hypothetical protein
MERTLGWIEKKVIFSEPTQYFSDMSDVIGEVVGLIEDHKVVEISGQPFIKDIAEDVIHEVLESGGSVGETEGHDTELVRPVASSKSRFPFVAFCYPNVVVSGPKVEFGEDLSFSETVQEGLDSGNGVPVFHSEVVQGSVINTKSECAVFLLGEDDRGASRGLRGTDESFLKVFFNKIVEGLEFGFRVSVNWAEGNFGVGFKMDFQIVGTMWRQGTGSGLGEHVCIVVILGRDLTQEVFLVRDRTRFGRGGTRSCGPDVYGTGIFDVATRDSIEFLFRYQLDIESREFGS